MPALGLLTYSVPVEEPPPPVGARVIVPLGARAVTGVVVEVGVSLEEAGLDAAAVKPLRQVLDHTAFIPGDVVELARWTGEYYASGVGEAIGAVLPPKTRGQRADGHRTRRIVVLTAAGLETTGRGARQREVLALLTAAPAGLPTAELAGRGVGADVVARLVRQGLVTIRYDRIERDPFSTTLAAAAREVAPELGAEQVTALKHLTTLADGRSFRVALLHGVTGSGKTEIYVRLSAAVRSSGRTVLMLVPEIALTPAVTSIFHQTFGDRTAVQHSGLSDGERHDQWQRIRRGQVDVVIGTRSAVFAPLERLGLAIVDEEHDTSYKQEESPRYNGRDVAIVRAQRAGALVVLGSATPSLESYQNALTGRYDLLALERRVLDRALASVTVVDMREEYAVGGPDVIISRTLEQGIHTRLDRSEQALVLLNRRGFATAVFCRQCAGTIDCPNCAVSLVVHGDGGSRRARCHYCNYSAPVPSVCPACRAPYMEQSGYGTQRVEAEIKRLCPGARVDRLDRDTVRRRGALAGLLSRFQTGDIDVLVGTQMIAKGHDFPRVTLVGVVSADVGLGMPDFRASERTFQLLTQVSGRAGRGEQPGEAVVQTLYPGHYSIRLACRQDYGAFFEREMRFRRAMRYPPSVALINVVVRARTFAGAMDDASDIVARVCQGEGASPDVRVLGPAPAPLGRLRGEYRAQFLVKGTSRRRMREGLLSALAARPDVQRRIVVDVDPVSLL